MRFVEITGGFYQVPISEEENLLLKKIEEASPMARKKLDEREREVARLLTSKGVLSRIKKDDALFYVRK